jgi:hypothetical protein
MCAALNTKEKMRVWVPNVENSLSLDIDFGDYTKNLKGAVVTDYVYSESLLKDNYEKAELCRGVYCRSRLYNISMVKNIKTEDNIHIRDSLAEFKARINRSGGFVDVIIKGVDSYGRVLVEVYDPVTEDLLNNIYMEEKYSNIFTTFTKYVPGSKK